MSTKYPWQSSHGFLYGLVLYHNFSNGAPVTLGWSRHADSWPWGSTSARRHRGLFDIGEFQGDGDDSPRIPVIMGLLHSKNPVYVCPFWFRDENPIHSYSLFGWVPGFPKTSYSMGWIHLEWGWWSPPGGSIGIFPPQIARTFRGFAVLPILGNENKPIGSIHLPYEFNISIPYITWSLGNWFYG